MKQLALLRHFCTHAALYRIPVFILLPHCLVLFKKKMTSKLELIDCAPYVNIVLEDTIPSGFNLKEQQGG